MTMKKQIADYENYLTEEEKSMATIEKYLRDVKAFDAFLGERELNKSEVIVYKKAIVRDYAPASVNSMLVSVNSFLKFIGRTECCVKLLKIQRQIFANENEYSTRSVLPIRTLIPPVHIISTAL